MIIRQLSELRARYQIDVKQLQDQIAKLSFERNKLEVENRDLKNSNEYLQSNFDNLNTKEREVQEL
jgi:cell division protein FtsB